MKERRGEEMENAFSAFMTALTDTSRSFTKL